MADRIAELTAQIETLKKELRAARLAKAPEPFEDFSFESADGVIKLSDLFGASPDLLIWHNMGICCNYCTLWADGLNGLTHQIATRCPLFVVSPDQVSVQQKTKADRGWSFNMIRDADKSFSIAAGYYAEYNGRLMFLPGISAFHKDAEGKIWRTNTASFGPGDDFCLVWPAFELLKGGIGSWDPVGVED